MTKKGLNINILSSCSNKNIIDLKMLHLIMFFKKDKSLLKTGNRQVATSFDGGILCYEYLEKENVVNVFDYFKGLDETIIIH